MAQQQGHRVHLVEVGGHNDICVLLDFQLILADDSDGCNEIYPAKAVARRLAGALGVKVEAMTWTPSKEIEEEWTYDDMMADVREIDAQLAGKKTKKR
jgi:hypothetical protein